MSTSSSTPESLLQKIGEFEFTPEIKGMGKIDRVGDGVITVSGLADAFLGEIIENSEGFKGLVLNLSRERAEVIVLKGFEKLTEGLEVFTTGQTLKVPSGENLTGRVVNPLGEPVDGLGPIEGSKEMSVERKSFGIIDRQPVDRPLQTGLKAIDAMIPIGRGQRELIIGDRGIGKTAIAIDTIINQRNNPEEPVKCIYIAIGQKESKTAQIVNKLKENGALDYTTVVTAGAASPVSWQYLAPYAGTAMAEYFLDKGQDALVVYDDLTKHAWAYRELSLVLRRPPGREAYPGDIFYLHSKLLERACQLKRELGGGSLTALPIIETQAGDVSAYIPTNVISITDGQIYLERELFHNGFRPAVNAGLSVSRVGGKAQVKLMKEYTGQLRLELAQYRELSAFSQFASDLDSETRSKLERGEKAMEILKQDQYDTLPLTEQIIIFWVLAQGYLSDVSVNQIRTFEKELLIFLRNQHPNVILEVKTRKVIDETLVKKLESALNDFKISHNYEYLSEHHGFSRG